MKENFNAVLEDKKFQEVFQKKTIQVIAPASGTSPEKIEQLRSLSLYVFHLDIPENILSPSFPYHASNDESRFQQLKMALLNPNNAIIWTLRGGYGSARLLDNLRKIPKPEQQKIFIGFSDNTALHLFLSQEWGWNTIHGSGFAQLLEQEQNHLNYLKISDIISKKSASQTLTDLKPMNQIARNIKTVKGPLTGGNLTLLENSIGTYWQVKAEEKILFIEEVGEKGYRIDRSLFHLYQAGILKNVKAIVLGQFLAPINDNTIPFALNRFAEEMDHQYAGIPVYKSEQFGHDKINYPLIYNVFSEVVFDESHNNYQLSMACPDYG